MLEVIVRSTRLVLPGLVALASLHAIGLLVTMTWAGGAEAPQLRREVPATDSTAASDEIPSVRNLFTAEEPIPAEVAPPEPSRPPEVVQETRLRIALLGTTFDPAGGDARALIREPSGDARNVGIDWYVADGQAVVESIERGRIVISIGDRRESVSFDPLPPTGYVGPEPPGARAALTMPQAEPASPRPRLQPRAPRRAEPRARPAPPIAALLTKLRAMVRFETVRSESGAPDGVRIADVTAGSLADELGFFPGDRILRVNGSRIRGDGLPPKLLRSLQSEGDPIVEIERPGGETEEIRIPRAVLLAME